MIAKRSPGPSSAAKAISQTGLRLHESANHPATATIAAYCAPAWPHDSLPPIHRAKARCLSSPRLIVAIAPGITTVAIATIPFTRTTAATLLVAIRSYQPVPTPRGSPGHTVSSRSSSRGDQVLAMWLAISYYDRLGESTSRAWYTEAPTPRKNISHTCSQFRPFRFGPPGLRALDWLADRSPLKQSTGVRNATCAALLREICERVEEREVSEQARRMARGHSVSTL